MNADRRTNTDGSNLPRVRKLGDNKLESRPFYFAWTEAITANIVYNESIMKIVLDTNQIHNNFSLRNSHLELLEKYLVRTKSELCMPRIVIEEHVQHFREQFENVKIGYDRIIQFAGIESNTITVEEAANNYRLTLENCLSELSYRELPYPDVSIEDLIRRAIEKRRPFGKAGKDFKDTLIWECVLQDLKNHAEQFVIISEDKGFTKGGNINPPQLHNDLVSDLTE